ncbi:MAG TPA: tetratricopeptide repeat protein [Caulobacteraceae bacterium]|jgi:tetratricopeptide (TPR) repeat protein|nr:tetratricopeptide repeat protein [Caulobacteraceae bacterium]
MTILRWTTAAAIVALVYCLWSGALIVGSAFDAGRWHRLWIDFGSLLWRFILAAFAFRALLRMRRLNAYVAATDRGAAAYRAKKYDRAVEAYDQALGAWPNDYDALYWRGWSLAHSGLFDRALGDFDAIVRMKPRRAFAWLGRGFVFTGMGEYDKAIADYDRAIKLKPRDTHGYDHRAYAWTQSGELDRAIADYDRVIALDRNNARAYRCRGYARAEKREFERAITDYDRAIALDPTIPQLFYNRGVAWTELGEHGRAITDFDTAEGICADDEGAAAIAYERGCARIELEQYDLAVRDFDRVLEFEPDSFKALYGRAWVREKQGDVELALTDVNAAIIKEPNHRNSRLLRISLLGDRGEHAAALADCDALVALGSDDPAVYLRRAWERALAGGDASASLEDCVRARELGEDDHAVCRTRGFVQFHAGRFVEALENYDRALVIDPACAHCRYCVGVCKLRLGRVEEGRADIAAVVAADPTVAETQAKYGVIP